MTWKVSISVAAKADMLDILTYITEELDSPQAASHKLKEIIKRIRMLETFPLSGVSLDAICGFDTAYRYLTCGNYLVFYRLEDTNVLVVRILYGKRDYLRVLFDETTSEDTAR